MPSPPPVIAPLVLLCDAINPSCNICKELSGVMPYTFDIGLLPDSQYYLFVRDKFGQIYSKSVITDVDGKFEIKDEEAPGMFNKYAGSFTIWLSESDTGSPRIELTIDEEEFTCINFKAICEES